MTHRSALAAAPALLGGRASSRDRLFKKQLPVGTEAPLAAPARDRLRLGS